METRFKCVHLVIFSFIKCLKKCLKNVNEVQNVHGHAKMKIQTYFFFISSRIVIIFFNKNNIINYKLPNTDNESKVQSKIKRTNTLKKS